MDIETLKDKDIANIKNLLAWKEGSFLNVNHEYQRAPVWTQLQKQMFIDSIFRGYPIPAFYFHDKHKEASGMKSHVRDIIDGQQRIDAISAFYKGGFSLLDPKKIEDFKFPNFVKDEPSPWGGKRFEELPDDLKEKFLKTPLFIYLIKTEEENKIRDLFIRLQGGTALTAQEKRDSWPGHFTKYVWKLGGKTGLEESYPGFSLFKRFKGGREDKRRHLAAQLAMLYFHREGSDKRDFCEIKSVNIDRFYHENIGFDDKRDIVKRFESIIKKIDEILPRGSYGLKGHEIIHLVFLVDLLLRDYASGWEGEFAEKFSEFRQRCQEASKAKKEQSESEHARYYEEYYHWTSAQSDAVSSIQRRHLFFVEEMISLVRAKQKDSKRAFTEAERERVYFRDKKKCQVCVFRDKSPADVDWDDMEIHHVIPHSQGGPTNIKNAALVHKTCHPHSEGEVDEFRGWWQKRPISVSLPPERKITGPEAFQKLPEGTECRHHGTGVTGKIVVRDGKKRLNIPQRGIVSTSFSGAHEDLEGRTANGWVTWDVKLPGTENWRLAKDWRESLSPTPTPYLTL